MIRRVCSRLFRIALGLVLVLLLLMALGIWRLAEKPLPLNLLTPYIKTVLPPSFNGLQVDVQDVVLAWHRQAKRIVVSARDMHIRDARGMVDATLPIVDVTLNLPSLLRQRVVALNRVYIDGAQMHLRDDPDNPLKYKLLAQLRGIAPTAPSVFKALEALIATLDRHPLVADLGTVHVINSAVTLQAFSLPQPLRISEFALMLRRTATTMSSELSMIAPLADTDIRFALNTSYERSTRQLTLKSEFGNLRPSALATLDPTLSVLSGISTPFNGSLKLALDQQTIWPVVDFDLQGGAGRMMLSGLYREPRQIEQLTVSGRLNGANGTLRIDTASLALASSNHGNPHLHFQGTMRGLRQPTHIEGHVTLKALTMADLDRYWPEDIGRDPRQWVTQNIPEGLIHQAKAHFTLGASEARQHTLAVQDINGSLQYDGLRVHYLRPLPPIQHITGTGQFNRSGFHFEIASGNLNQMALTAGEVDITGLDRHAGAISIRTHLTGSLQEALTLLKHPPLNLMADLGIPLETAAGQFLVEPQIAFSLGKSIRLEDVDINVQGVIQNVSLPKAILSQDLSHGQLRINLDKRRMTLKGQAELATIPLSFTWHQALSKPNTDGWRSHIHVVVPHLGHTGRTRLGYALPDVLKGPMTAIIDARSSWDKKQTVNIQIDLQNTTLNLPWLHWHKPEGEPAKATGTLQLTANRAVAFTDLHLETNSLRVHGSAQFDATGTALARCDLSHVTFGTSDLRDVVCQRLNPGLAITVGDGFLDVAPFRHLFIDLPTTQKAEPTQPTVTFPVYLHVPRLRQVQMAPDRYLKNVQAHVAWNGTGWQAINVSGQVPDERSEQSDTTPANAATAPKTFDFHYLPTTKKHPNLLFQTNDIGSILRALNVYDNLIGGDVTLTGRTNDGKAGIQAKLKASQFTLRRAPVIAHVLAAASLHGLTNLLSSDGLKFDNLEAEIILHGNRLAIKQSHAHGGSLGITAQGDIPYQSGDLDVQGTIIPAYLVNSILGQVPVVNLLVGGKGQGLVAVNYHLSGQFAKPQVSVNPISALTPGFLRGVFGLFEQNSDDHTQPSSPNHAPDKARQMSEP